MVSSKDLERLAACRKTVEVATAEAETFRNRTRLLMETLCNTQMDGSDRIKMMEMVEKLSEQNHNMYMHLQDVWSNCIGIFEDK